jgi:hypothetical protein
MSVATGTAIAVGATAAAGVAGSAIAAHAQGSATDKAVAAEQGSAANSLAFNREVYGNTVANEAPFVTAGNQAVTDLSTRLSNGSLTSPYPGGAFSFTPADWQADPAFGWQEQQGEQAIQRTAAAQGGLVSGGALKDIAGYSHGLTSTNYQQQYANALSAYQMAYNQFQDTNSNTFSRLMGVAGLGQGAASNTAAAGTSAAGTAAGISGSTANALSNLYTGQAGATTGAIAAGTNAITGGVNYLANQQMMSGSSYGTPMVPYTPTYPVDPRTGI